MDNMYGKTEQSMIDHRDDMKTGHDSMEDMHQESVTVPMTILGGKEKEFKPGDEVVLRIKSMQGDMVELEYAPEKAMEEDHMDMEHMSKDDMMKMTSSKMEKHLPMAKRDEMEY